MVQQARNIEVFRDAPSLPGSDLEQRREQRSRMVYRLVRVEVYGDEGLARCRNISNHGMKLELTMPVQVGAMLKVAFSSSFLCVGRVIWARGCECGIALDCPIDADAILRASVAETGAENIGGLSLRSEVPAKVCFDGKAHDAMSSNVSLRGMQLRHDGAFRPGLHVMVMLGRDRQRRGVVRWSRGDIADLVLLDPFSVSELGSVGALAAA